MKNELRKYIAHWAFLPLDGFEDDESLRAKRKYFWMTSKMGMLVDATYPKKFDFDCDEMYALDTLNDFVEYLHSKGCKEIIPFDQNKP